jgi:hypothetical protein
MSNREKLLAKIRALMAKTEENGCTMAEAMFALQKVQELRDSHQVDDDELRAPEAVTTARHSASDPIGCKTYLGVSIANFCQVRVWRQDGGFQFAGMPADIQLADFLLESLARYVQRELATFMLGQRAQGARRRQIMEGFIAGASKTISKRLDELTAASASHQGQPGQALTIRTQALVDAYLADRGFVQTGRGTKRKRVNGDARAAGQAAGERASFARPIGGATGGPRLT